MNFVQADETTHDNDVRLYRTPEERRDTGLGREINNWLTISGLTELEKNYIENNFSDNKEKIYDRPNINIQLNFDIEVSDWLTAELILESDYDMEARDNENRIHVFWDEAFLEADLDSWAIKVGRQYYPFGEYYSHFITGPLLEFGETRGTGLIVDYSVSKNIELSTFIFESNYDKNTNKEKFDWGISFELLSKDESKKIGFGYLSDLSESEQGFLVDKEVNEYVNRVSAWNAYLRYGFDALEFSAEMIRAKSSFNELESQENKPFSYNLEIAYFYNQNLQIATRFEHSDEVSEEPETQYGISFTWAPIQHMTLSVDYLYGRIKREFVLNDNEAELKNRDTLAIALSMEF